MTDRRDRRLVLGARFFSPATSSPRRASLLWLTVSVSAYTQLLAGEEVFNTSLAPPDCLLWALITSVRSLWSDSELPLRSRPCDGPETSPAGPNSLPPLLPLPGK